MPEKKIAEKAIVKKNELGQRVVVVPKGQPIPGEFVSDKPKAKKPAAKKVAAPVEDKARKGPRKKSD
jgi:hypothetical protein